MNISFIYLFTVLCNVTFKRSEQRRMVGCLMKNELEKEETGTSHGQL
jgi:hypothetical protein